MKKLIAIALSALPLYAGMASAQNNIDLKAPIPIARANPAVPAPSAQPAPLPLPIPSGPKMAVTGKVDNVLERIERSLQNTPESDAALEQAVTRQMNLLQSTDKALRPVGYVAVGQHKYILISRDGKTVTRLREGSAMGPIKVVQIEEDGVNYRVGEKVLFSPLSFQTSEPPKPPQNNNSQANTAQPTTGTVAGAGAQGPIGR